MGEYKCYYYSLASGEKPVEDFITSLNEKSKEKFQYAKGLLEVSGRIQNIWGTVFLNYDLKE